MSAQLIDSLMATGMARPWLKALVFGQFSYRKFSPSCSWRAKSFDAAHDTLVGIELMHMLKKRQLVVEEAENALSAAEQFYALAA